MNFSLRASFAADAFTCWAIELMAGMGHRYVGHCHLLDKSLHLRTICFHLSHMLVPALNHSQVTGHDNASNEW